MTGIELEMKPKLFVKRLNEKALLPIKGSPASAGYDVHAFFEDCGFKVIYPGKRLLIKTGIAVACPEDCYVRVAPRSGLANKIGINVLAGVVDSDYRGEVGVILHHTGMAIDEFGGVSATDDPFIVRQGDRIAQLIVERFQPTDLVEMDDLPETVRGAGGFGSTGV